MSTFNLSLKFLFLILLLSSPKDSLTMAIITVCVLLTVLLNVDF